eukprot:524185_1
MFRCLQAAKKILQRPKLLYSPTSATITTIILKRSNNDKVFNAELVVGILRLEYPYPVGPDDVDDKRAFRYKTEQRVVKGLTFEKCQKGDDLEGDTKDEFIKTLKYFRSIPKITGIIGDCGFMLNYQQLALEENAKLKENEEKQDINNKKKIHRIPIALSPLMLIPTILAILQKNEQMLVVTANAANLKGKTDEHNKTGENFNGLMEKYFGYTAEYVNKRFIIVGGDKIDGFGYEIQHTEKIKIKKAESGFIELIGEQVNDESNNIGAILFECTQIPVFQSVIQKNFALPVWDALDLADFIHSGSSIHVH